jgi:carbamoyltransferase
MKILGVHIGHDASATIVEDGTIIASAAEERFVRIKHYGGMPLNSAIYCLEEAGISSQGIDAVAYSGHTMNTELNTLFRLGEDARYNLKGCNLSLKEKFLNTLKGLVKPLSKPPPYLKLLQLGENTPIHYVSHHRAHAASAYYTSGNQEKTLIITSDGAGEDGKSLTVWQAEGGKMTLIKSFATCFSYGFFYSAVTEALGWWVGDGEGTVMGLAPYGRIDAVPEEELSWLLPHFKKGDFAAPVDFGKIHATRYQDVYYWHFGVFERLEKIVAKYGKENVAARLQDMLENELLGFITYWKQKTGITRCATAGGVFLNVKLNQKVVDANLFEDYYIYPDSGDSGISAGAALDICVKTGNGFNRERVRDVFWGPSFEDKEIKLILDERGLNYRRSENVAQEIAAELHKGKIAAWFQGRMECGPRALGGRSILFDARQAENKDIVNKTVKFREPFRPFCPSMKVESASKYLTNSQRIERYMISAYEVKPEMREIIAAVTHVDGTCRPQMIEKEIYPAFWNLLNEYEKLTGDAILMNTSFNIKGEPIVCTPRDALKCFFDTGIQVLALGSYILEK